MSSTYTIIDTLQEGGGTLIYRAVRDADGRRVVIKALGPSLKGVRGFAGASELGDQRIALVIDAPALIEEMLAGGQRLGPDSRGLHG